MKKSIASLASAGILAIINVSPATAATLHPANMTCKEFLSLDRVERPKVVYWAEGIRHSGKPEGAVIDIESTESVIPIVVEQCTAEPTASFWDKLEISWHKFSTSVEKHL